MALGLNSALDLAHGGLGRLGGVVEHGQQPAGEAPLLGASCGHLLDGVGRPQRRHVGDLGRR